MKKSTLFPLVLLIIMNTHYATLVSASDLKNSNIIAVSSNTYHGFSIEEAISGISEAGFKYIELTAVQGWTEHILRDQSFSRLCEIKDKLDKAGLTVLSLSGHTNLMDDNHTMGFIQNIQLAAFFGSKYIVSSIGEAHPKDDVAVSDEDVAQRIKIFLPYLEKYDITLVLEVHGTHNSGKILNTICTLIGSDRVKINYDTANAIYWGNMTTDNMLLDFQENISNISYIHIKDKAGNPKDWNFPALGEGYIPFKSIFDTLNRSKNYSPLSIEIEFTQDGVKSIADVNEALKISAAYLKANGFNLK